MVFASQEVCVDVDYLCAHKSTTIMIDMLEDEVALETQKYKMPYIHSQMEKQYTLHLFVLCVLHIPSFFYYYFVVPYSSIIHFTLHLSCHISFLVCHLLVPADLSSYVINLGLSSSYTPKPSA